MSITEKNARDYLQGLVNGYKHYKQSDYEFEQDFSKSLWNDFVACKNMIEKLTEKKVNVKHWIVTID